MATIKLHAGDWGEAEAQLVGDTLCFPGASIFKPEMVKTFRLKTVEMASEESVKRVGGTVGWGLVGAVALGPVGLLAGLLLGGKSKEVTFVAQFGDGRKMLATTDSKTYTKIKAAVF